MRVFYRGQAKRVMDQLERKEDSAWFDIYVELIRIQLGEKRVAIAPGRFGRHYVTLEDGRVAVLGINRPQIDLTYVELIEII